MIEDVDRDLFRKCMPHFDTHPIVFDIGAHMGHYTMFVLGIIPTADCYLFEPNSYLLKDFNGGGVFSYAVCNSNDNKVFHIPPKQNDELSSLYKRGVFDQTGWTETDVQCITVDRFCELMDVDSIDYLKADVEGSEFEVLKGCKYMLSNKKIKFLQIEYGGTYHDAKITFTEIISFAHLYGYHIYELIDGNLIEATHSNFIEDYRYQNFILTYLPC